MIILVNSSVQATVSVSIGDRAVAVPAVLEQETAPQFCQLDSHTDQRAAEHSDPYELCAILEKYEGVPLAFSNEYSKQIDTTVIVKPALLALIEKYQRTRNTNQVKDNT